jgi:hypothetical protein
MSSKDRSSREAKEILRRLNQDLREMLRQIERGQRPGPGRSSREEDSRTSGNLPH